MWKLQLLSGHWKSHGYPVRIHLLLFMGKGSTIQTLWFGGPSGALYLERARVSTPATLLVRNTVLSPRMTGTVPNIFWLTRGRRRHTRGQRPKVNGFLYSLSLHTGDAWKRVGTSWSCAENAVLQDRTSQKRRRAHVYPVTKPLRRAPTRQRRRGWPSRPPPEAPTLPKSRIFEADHAVRPVIIVSEEGMQQRGAWPPWEWDRSVRALQWSRILTIFF